MFKDTKCRGVIEESDSPWTSPLIFVQKDRSLWFFMNYRRLNFTKQGCFLLPRIKNTLDTLAGAKWFSTLDLNWILAGSTASWRQKGDSILHWANTVAVHSHVFQPLPCYSDTLMANGVFLGRRDLQRWQQPMQTTWLSNSKTYTTSPTKTWKWTVTAWRHYIWPVGQLSWFPRRWPSLVLPPYPEEGKVKQDAVKLGRPIQCSNPNKWCDRPNPAAYKTISWRFQRSQRQRQEKVLSRKAEIHRKR